MTRFQYYVASSVDGFIATRDDSLDWLLQFDGFDGQQESYKTFMAGIGAIVMGADTYRFILGAEPETWPYEHIPTWVFTHQELPGYADADITFVRGDVGEFAADIAADAGLDNVWIVGGGALARQFLDAGRLDDLILTVVPVILGDGKPLIAGPLGPGSIENQPPMPWTLLGTRTFGSGVVELQYRLTESSGAPLR